MKLHLFVVCRKSQCVVRVMRSTMAYSTAQRHCPLTRRPEPARALIVNI